jgi:hypothetical protein
MSGSNSNAISKVISSHFGNLMNKYNSLKREFSDFVNFPLFNKIKDVVSDENEKIVE